MSRRRPRPAFSVCALRALLNDGSFAVRPTPATPPPPSHPAPAVTVPALPPVTAIDCVYREEPADAPERPMWSANTTDEHREAATLPPERWEC